MSTYEELRKSVKVGSVIQCIDSDTVVWKLGAYYDVIGLDIDSIKLSRQHFGESKWLWPWSRSHKIDFLIEKI